MLEFCTSSFGAPDDYFAGAFFTLVPDVAIFEDMIKALGQSGHAGKNFVYGEQDFLVSAAPS
jgi:hypothetical protein